jgi:rhamnose utilization protein RhaD (predicted bifunctional aldolase and dehydrogenase)/NAD(P)-dependent dehydrogenase (short-subunit alcohol dehydrogenase family)
MESRWNDCEASLYAGELGPRIYTSRLLGAEPSLVLFGGGNTSVKLPRLNVFDEEEDVLYVKGSGLDLATVDEGGFVPTSLEHLRRLTRLEELDDLTLARELRLAKLEPEAPAPSVEALLHAVLPHRYVDHTHAEAVLALTNTPSGEEHVRSAFGRRVLVIGYAQPGFALGRACLELIGDLAPETIGLVLLNHGLVSFGDTARESYERMIELVEVAEDYFADRVKIEKHADGAEAAPSGVRLTALRRDISAVAGFPVVLRHDHDSFSSSFARRDDVADLSQSGPATPDHVIWTKRLPLVGTDVIGYADAYRGYFDAYATGGVRMLDPAPRIVLDPELGLCAVGRNAAEAEVALEIYRRTISLILRADALQKWKALDPADVFAVEYWNLEQEKLHRRVGVFEGETAVVTGAASGIGAACAERLLAEGAAVCGLDIQDASSRYGGNPAFLGLGCDVSKENEVRWALEKCAQLYGGIDMLILAAGVFPPSSSLDALSLSEWRRVFEVNTDANLLLLRLAFPFLKLAPNGGRVVIIASKNVPAPGPGAGAYSASKAALTQLARVAALEFGQSGIRVNVIHPNAVFDTGIWSDDVIRARAEQYGLTPDEYRTQNVLSTEVGSSDVAELAAAMCGSAFAKTTGAQVPVDGGNDRVI